LKLAGFALDAQGRWQFAAMAPDRRTRFLELFGSRRAELLKLNLVHGDPDGWKREKEARKPGEDFAAAYRAPSFHSLLNPYESFAEWTALAQLEPQKAEKINPELTRWLKEKVLAGNAPSAAALARAAKVPIADVHLHLEKSFTPSALRAAMDRNGVRWAGAVGPGPRDEAPSDFRSAFQKALGSRYIATLGQPELGSPGGLDDAASPALKAVLARADDEFKAGSLKGFGELFVNNMTSSPEPSWKRKVQADSPAMRALYAAAAAHGGFLQIHMEADPDSLAQLERLLSIEPRAAVILSHCALNATAAQMLPLMASHPNLYCELSHRSPPTLSGPRLAERKIFDEAGVDAAWLSVIESMPDRFMVGTDAIGSDYDAAVASLRRGLLARLSPAAMRKVADENAKRVMRLR
jgi:predicted TIM-barrel fold metal-dependent hydrolase